MRVNSFLIPEGYKGYTNKAKVQKMFKSRLQFTEIDSQRRINRATSTAHRHAIALQQQSKLSLSQLSHASFLQQLGGEQ